MPSIAADRDLTSAADGDAEPAAATIVPTNSVHLAQAYKISLVKSQKETDNHTFPSVYRGHPIFKTISCLKKTVQKSKVHKKDISHPFVIRQRDVEQQVVCGNDVR